MTYFLNNQLPHFSFVFIHKTLPLNNIFSFVFQLKLFMYTVKNFCELGSILLQCQQ